MTYDDGHDVNASVQRLIEVADQIVGRLEADRQPDESSRPFLAAVALASLALPPPKGMTKPGRRSWLLVAFGLRGDRRARPGRSHPPCLLAISSQPPGGEQAALEIPDIERRTRRPQRLAARLDHDNTITTSPSGHGVLTSTSLRSGISASRS